MKNLFFILALLSISFLANGQATDELTALENKTNAPENVNEVEDIVEEDVITAPFFPPVKIKQPKGVPFDGGEDISDLLKSRKINWRIKNLYAANGNKSLWLVDGAPTNLYSKLPEIIKQAELHGLNPAHYSISEIDITNPKSEILLTKQLTNLAYDIAIGRVDPKVIRNVKGVYRKKKDLSPIILSYMNKQSFSYLLDAVAPKYPEYHQLKKMLPDFKADYDPADWVKIKTVRRIDPGKKHKYIPAIRDRLVQFDFLKKSNDDSLYDEEMVEAIRAFQYSNSLSADGVIGARTIQALNSDPGYRIDQIKINMERWRWVKDDLGEQHIRINVPDFMLYVYDDHKPVKQMKVIVGKPYKKTKTPIASRIIKQITFNPTWGVPKRIAVDSLLPKIKRDPRYLKRGGFILTDGETKERVDPETIDWSSVDKENFNYSLTQNSGRRNALGKIRFHVENNSAVHLHDTPSRSLFKRGYRALSNACIRVEDPEGLAEFVMRKKEGWDDVKIDKMMNKSRRQRTILTNDQLQTHMLYWTAWVDNDKNLQFRNDLYGYDRIVGKYLF